MSEISIYKVNKSQNNFKLDEKLFAQQENFSRAFHLRRFTDSRATEKFKFPNLAIVKVCRKMVHEIIRIRMTEKFIYLRCFRV